MSRVLPILFNTEMVRAILDGKKTVTRRICKDGDEYAVPDMDFFDTDKRTYAVHSYADMEHTEKLSIAERLCPICPGDILYVRETWTKLYYVDPDGYTHYDQEMYFYAADGVPDISLVDPDGFEKDDQRIRWHPSIHMPKEAARIWLKVTDVRVERLQEITEEQAQKEGCAGKFTGTGETMGCGWDVTPTEEFAKLWDTTVNPKDCALYGWNANPWVWVIEFERCGKPGE